MHDQDNILTYKSIAPKGPCSNVYAVFVLITFSFLLKMFSKQEAATSVVETSKVCLPNDFNIRLSCTKILMTFSSSRDPLTFLDVLVVNFHILLPIRPVLLVLESNQMAKLVHDNSVSKAAAAQWRSLSSSNFAHIGVTPVGKNWSKCIHCKMLVFTRSK